MQISLMIRPFMISSTIIMCSITAMIFDYLTKELYYLLIYLSFLGIVGIGFQVQLYHKFKKRIYSTEIEIQKDKKELFEKFRV